MNRRILAATLGLSLAACATTPPRYQARPLAPPAARLFELTESTGPGLYGSIDLERLRELGLVASPQGKDGAAKKSGSLGTMLVSGLASATTVSNDEGQRQLFARLAVYGAVLSEWTAWPHVQKLGFSIPITNPEDKEFIKSSLLLIAVDRGEAANREVLQGFLALGRAAAARSGELLTTHGGALCIERPELPFPLCLSGGDGYYALGTQPALVKASEQLAAAPSTARAAQASPMGLRFRMDPMGRAELRVEGTAALAVSVRLDGVQPKMVAQLEGMVRGYLARWDEDQQTKRELLAATLAETNATLAADPQAPAGLKAAAQKLTPESITDRDGYLRQVRQSFKIEPLERGLAMSLSLPAALVSNVGSSMSEMNAPVVVGVVGVLAAIAIPNFIKFQCRSKQSEAKANLKGLYTSERAFQAEMNRWSESFQEIGFQPEPGTRYNYCLGASCLPCTFAGCRQVAKGANPCAVAPAQAPIPAPVPTNLKGRKSAPPPPPAEPPQMCAFAQLSSGAESNYDVWLIGPDGELAHPAEGCR